ncbi:MAG: B-box zinc finger protein [Candidatus Hodarchaeota archaeon]
MTIESHEHILCPVCGGRILVEHTDKVNHCEYCASPVLGPKQSRQCVNHPEKLGIAVCNTCGDLLCAECMEERVADYGGKLLSIVHCEKPECVMSSGWGKPLNREFQRLVNFDWADRQDNLILRVTGLGAIVMMVFELYFILALMWLQFFTSWGTSSPSPIPFLFVRGDAIVILSILGNVLSAMILQTSLQVYIHERQLGAGIMLLVILIIEAAYLLFRGWLFNLLSAPFPWLVPLLLIAFGVATLMVFLGSLSAIWVGLQKRNQIEKAKKKLGLQ